MAEWHRTRNPQRRSGIDTVGWLFSVFVSVVIAVAAVIAYEANDTSPANTTVSHMPSPHPPRLPS
jgi:predicted Co/Zn/Cd cation transporter (cation efflux family)